MPETVTKDLADGVYRADVQGNGLSVLKEGENFFVVQPTTRKISRALGLEELTNTLRGVRSEVAAEGRMALKKDASGKTYVSVDSTKIDASQSPKQIISVLSDIVRTKFTDFVQVNGQKIGINQRAAKEWVASRDASALMRIDNQKFLDKANAFENADEILQAARDYIGEARKHERKDNFVEFARGVVTFEVEGRGYDADVIVGTTKSGVALLYDLVNIQDKKITTGESDTAQDRRHETPVADISITENAEKSNSFAEKNSANDANSDTSANLEGATPPPQAVPRPSQGADGKSEQGAVQKSAQEAEDDGKARREAIAIDVWARENIPDYAGLNAPARGAVRATVRNARAHGISNEEVLVYARVAARSGLSIAFDVAQAQAGDARYNMRNTIFVDPNAPASRRRSKLLLHEGGHALFLRTKSGRKLMEQAFRLCDPETAKQVREDYTKYYEKQELTKEQYEPIIEEEIAAAGLERALGVDGAWEFILSKRPTAGEKLLSFFRGAARDYAGVGELSAEARKLLRTYQKAFAELSARNQGNNAVTGVNGEKTQDGGKKLAFGGEKAKTADKMKLSTAQQMLAEGVDSETIRQETGWFQGYDGKWRFEIDDSKMEFSKEGAFLPSSTKLEAYVKHDALFEAYPALKNVKVEFRSGVDPEYDGETILLDDTRTAEEIKASLLHELQHVIQNMEEFATGANVPYWETEMEGKPSATYENLYLRAIYYKEQIQSKASPGLITAIKKAYPFVEKIHQDEQMLTVTPEELDPALKRAREEGLYHSVWGYFLDTSRLLAFDKKHNGDNPVKRYLRTAGEVEAFDIASRMNMSGEERKNTRPDIDREDVVFADRNSVFAKKPVAAMENGFVAKNKKAADDGGRLARAKGKQRTYSYNELVRKGDLTGIVVKKGQQISFKSNGTIDSTAVIDAVKNKCEALTTARAGTVYYVEVPDIGKRVEITRTGIEHGYHEGLKKSRKAAFDKAKINARVSLELPQLLKNSIEVNISDRSDNLDVPYSHVMMGTVALEDSNGVLEYYAVRSVIEERVNQNPVLAEMNVLGKLHAANAKKIGPPNGRGGNTVALTVADAYTYSIADFLQNVKGVFDDTFSLDVYQRLGVPRAVNDFSKNMRFALPKDGEPKVPTWGKESYSFAEVAGEKLTAEEVADFQGTLEKKVGAERTKYKAKAKDFVFTRAASIYIDTVDELYGISHFLKNAGGVRDAAAIVNVARSSISQAQTMIGHVQYELFAEKPKKLGKGLQKILAPVMPQIKAFNNYLLNYHNVDRMSLEERSGAQQIALAERVDAFTGFEEDRVSNLSINKDTVKNAHKLLIEPVHVVYMRHLKAISLYHGLGVFTDNFNRLFNLNINGPQTKNTAERAVGKVVVSLESNTELDERIANSKNSRSKVLREYLVEKFGGRTFTMSDGRSVVMDNTDAKELSQHAGEKKSAQLANLEKLIEKAIPAGEDLLVEHKKFTEFHYYAVTVKYGADEMDLLLNVGVAKNDGSNHLYSITDNKREAPTHYGVSGPVGNRIKSASPTDSIPQNDGGVNHQTVFFFRLDTRALF